MARDTEAPSGPIASMRHPKLFADASRVCEVLAERRLRGWSMRTLPTVRCRVNLPGLVDHVLERHKFPDLKSPKPDSAEDSACVLSDHQVSQTGLYGVLHVALCHAWASAYPAAEFVAYEQPPRETYPERTGGKAQSFASRYREGQGRPQPTTNPTP